MGRERNAAPAGALPGPEDVEGGGAQLVRRFIQLKRCDTLLGAGRTISFNPHLLPNTAKLYGLNGAAVQSASSRCQCLASDRIGKSQALAAFVHPASDHGLRRKPGHRFLGSALPIGGRERRRKPKRVGPQRLH